MIGKYKIITLCGSSKFKNEFEQVQKELTLSGNIVMSLGLFTHFDGDKIDKETLKMLTDMHFQKIDMSDEIFVINPGGYIGSATASEIEYALKTGKKVSYLE